MAGNFWNWCATVDHVSQLFVATGWLVTGWFAERPTRGQSMCKPVMSLSECDGVDSRSIFDILKIFSPQIVQSTNRLTASWFVVWLIKCLCVMVGIVRSTLTWNRLVLIFPIYFQPWTYWLQSILVRLEFLAHFVVFVVHFVNFKALRRNCLSFTCYPVNC